MQNHTIKLKDTRLIGVAEYGDPKGAPIFYFHGFPGSRLEPARFDQIAAENGFRLIGLDRPGMGLSSYDKTRTILSWADDVLAVADSLGIDKFSVIGHSGGGPFVAACAFAIKKRLIGAVIVSGMPPMGEKLGSRLIVALPWLTTIMMKLTRMMLNNPKMMQKAIGKLPDCDRDVFENPESGKALIQSTLEAFRNGLNGPAQEMRILFGPWGFDLEKITIPVKIWHGALDTQCPVPQSKAYASLIPGSQLVIIENEGHHSILQNNITEILRMSCNRL